MEPLTALYAIVGGLSLVGADSYLSSYTIHVETSVAPIYEQSGFNEHVVESLLLAELDKIVRARSLVKAPHLLSNKDQPVSSALAQAAGLSAALSAAESTFGVTHPSLLVSAIVEKEDGKDIKRFIVAGDTDTGRNIGFSVPLLERSVDDALKEVAFKAMLEINPYIAILYSLELSEAAGQTPVEAEQLLTQVLEDSSPNQADPERARFENLMGLTQLLMNDAREAEVWFGKSEKSDDDFIPAKINGAFTALLTGDCGRAIELVSPIVASEYWPMTRDKFMLYASYNTLGVCQTRQGNFEEANANFAAAAAERPDGMSVYYYWAHALSLQGNLEQSRSIMDRAGRNISNIENYPEIAMLHYWAPEEGDNKLVKLSPVPPIATGDITPRPTQAE